MAIHKASVSGMLHGSRVCRTAPAVSNLLFADDCLLFCKGTRAEYQALKALLDDYELASGQAINYSKSGVFFSKNISEEVRNALKDILGVQNLLNTGRYLGLSSLVGREK